MATQYKVICDCCGEEITGHSVRLATTNDGAGYNLYANCNAIRPYYFSLDLCSTCYENIVNCINDYIAKKQEENKNGIGV